MNKGGLLKDFRNAAMHAFAGDGEKVERLEKLFLCEEVIPDPEKLLIQALRKFNSPTWKYYFRERLLQLAEVNMLSEADLTALWDLTIPCAETDLEVIFDVVCALSYSTSGCHVLAEHVFLRCIELYKNDDPRIIPGWKWSNLVLHVAGMLTERGVKLSPENADHLKELVDGHISSEQQQLASLVEFHTT